MPHVDLVDVVNETNHLHGLLGREKQGLLVENHQPINDDQLQICSILHGKMLRFGHRRQPKRTAHERPAMPYALQQLLLRQ